MKQSTPFSMVRYAAFLGGIVVAGLVVWADLYSKSAVQARWPFQEPIVLAPFLNGYLTYNHAGAFGFLSHTAHWAWWILVPVACGTIALLLWWLWGWGWKATWAEVVAIGMVLGGGIANAYERAVYYAVTDYIDVHWGAWHWPTFNVADIAISCGAFVLLCNLWSQD